jgi:aspartyl-tRNA(Asn)/glutamyl-tRNA(Gln) amidotransferase subunit C
MADLITPEIFNRLVELAALELGAEEADYVRRELNNQLKAIHELEAIPMDIDVPISLHGVPYPPEISPSPRRDDWAACPDTDKILAQVPQLDERYIVVPDIPHTKLD